jgi:CheY-like chemotaxis protein
MAAPTRILVVEDERLVAQDLQRRLHRLGFTVCAIAASGPEAIAHAAQTQPDLILMDIVLHGPMDGIEAAAQIRAQADIPVIYLSAHADDATRQRAKATEPFGYLLKPFDTRVMQTTIEMALYKHSMEHERAHLLRHLQEALAHITTLRGLLPICAVCKKIRDDQGYWQQVEVYISQHSEAQFTHGICPDCVRTRYADLVHGSQGITPPESEGSPPPS